MTELIADLLLRQTIQVLLVCIAVWIVLRYFAKNRPHLGRVLCVVVLLKCLTPPVFSSYFGIFSHVANVPVHASADTSYRTTDSPIARVLPGGTGVPAYGHNGLSESTGRDNDAAVRGTNRSVAAALSSQSTAAPRWLTVCVVCWISGMLVTSTIIVFRWRSLLIRLNRASVPVPTEIETMLDHLCRQLGVSRRKFRICVTSDSAGPAVVGLRRPTIVLPQCLVQQNQPKYLEPVLAHELIHIRRGDLFVSFLLILVRIMLWFHPIIRLLSALLNRETERSCDDEVLNGLRCRPADYARSLLFVLQQKQLQPMPAFPGVRAIDITSQRMERIMRTETGSQKRTPIWYWLAMLVLAAMLLPGAALVAGDDTPVADSHAREKQINPPAAAVNSTARPEISPPEKQPHQSSVESFPHLADAVKEIESTSPEGSPSDRRILEAVAGDLGITGDLDTFLRENASKLTIVKEQLSRNVDAPKLYPLVGPAQLHHLTYRCTVHIGNRKATTYVDTEHVVRVSDSKRRQVHGFRRREPLADLVSLNFTNCSLREAFRLISQQHGVNVVLDEEGMHEAGVTVNEPVSFEVDGIRLNSALRLLLVPRGLDFKWDDQVVVVTSIERARPWLTRVYAVADLVVPDGNQVVFRSADGTDVKSDVDPENRKADADPLIELITTTVAPESWDIAGGSGKLSFYEQNLSLVIRANPETHDQIADLLTQLRRLQDIQIRLRARVLTLNGKATPRDATAEETNFRRFGGIVTLDAVSAADWREELTGDGAVSTPITAVSLFNAQVCEYTLGTNKHPQVCRLQALTTPGEDLIRVSITLSSEAGDEQTQNHLLKCASGDVLALDLGSTGDAGKSRRMLFLEVDVLDAAKKEQSR